MPIDFTPPHLKPLIAILSVMDSKASDELALAWTDALYRIGAGTFKDHGQTGEYYKAGWEYLSQYPAKAAVGWPWAAVAALRSPSSSELPSYFESASLTVSLPSALRLNLGPLATSNMVDMRDAAAKIIRESRRQLFFTSPYWDKSSVLGLLKEHCRDRRDGLRVYVLGPHTASDKVNDVFQAVKSHFTRLGAKVIVVTPSSLPRMANETVLHAKIISGDSHTALISSANLTHNGLHRNLELGVLLQGGVVASLENLLLSIVNLFSLTE